MGVLKVKESVTGVLNVTGGLSGEGLSGSTMRAIKKVVIGRGIDGTAGGDDAGLLNMCGDLSTVKVKGSVIGGADHSGIVIGGSAGKIKISGSLTSGDPDKPVTISAFGTIGVSKEKEAVALKHVQVGSDVLNAEILAGYGRDGTPSNADAGIGKIIVEGNWSASNAVAGVEDTTIDLDTNFTVVDLA